MKKNDKQLAVAIVEQLGDVSKSEVEGVAKDLVEILAARNQTHRIKSVIRALDAAWASRYGAATVSVTSAYPLSDTLREKLSSVAHGAELRETVDKNLIGGATVRIDERIIDGSIKGQLEQLSSAFSRA